MEKYYYYSKGSIDDHVMRSSNGFGKATSVWDCGSTLYDSYELNSLKRQIGSAIANSPARTLSMPHLQQHQHYRPREFSLQPQPHHHLSSSSKSSSFKISRPFQKLLRFVFNKSSNNNNNNNKPSVINSSTLASSHYISNNKSRSGSSTNNYFEKGGEKYSKERLYVVYDNNINKNNSSSKCDQAVLSTIPEVPEVEIMAGVAGFSPEITTSSLVKKSASERFHPTTSIAISCA